MKERERKREGSSTMIAELKDIEGFEATSNDEREREKERERERAGATGARE